MIEADENGFILAAKLSDRSDKTHDCVIFYLRTLTVELVVKHLVSFLFTACCIGI